MLAQDLPALPLEMQVSVLEQLCGLLKARIANVDICCTSKLLPRLMASLRNHAQYTGRIRDGPGGGEEAEACRQRALRGRRVEAALALMSKLGSFAISPFLLRRALRSALRLSSRAAAEDAACEDHAATATTLRWTLEVLEAMACQSSSGPRHFWDLQGTRVHPSGLLLPMLPSWPAGGYTVALWLRRDPSEYGSPASQSSASEGGHNYQVLLVVLLKSHLLFSFRFWPWRRWRFSFQKSATVTLVRVTTTSVTLARGSLR